MTASLRPFWFSYGVSAAVDALSGMTVNLVLVDQWAEELLSSAQAKNWQNYADFFQHAGRELENKAQTEKATVARLELIDDENVLWLYFPKTQRIFWQQKVAVNVGENIKEEAFWLQMKADHKMALNQIDHFRYERWKDVADLQKHLTMLEEASLISHRTGAELRLK